MPRDDFTSGCSQSFVNTGFGRPSANDFGSAPTCFRDGLRDRARGGCVGRPAQGAIDVNGGGFRGNGSRGASGGVGRAGFEGDPSRPTPEYYVPVARSVADVLKDDELDAQQQDFYEEDSDVEVNGLNENHQYAVLDTWADGNFEPELLANLEKSQYIRPRKIQKHTIPLILDGYDVKGNVEMGGGKTVAFLLPIIQWIITQKKAGVSSRATAPFALIIEPTHELALQLSEQARKLCHGFPKAISVKVAKAYGGYHYRENYIEIACGCDILICTAGRLHHLAEKGNILFNLLEFLVLDEADRLLDDCFLPQLREIMDIKGFPEKNQRQTLLFSATFPYHTQMLSEKILRKGNVMVLRNARKPVSATVRIKPEFIPVEAHEKKDKLFGMLEMDKEVAEKVNGKNYMLAFRRTLIFVNSKNDANVLCNALTAFGIPTASVNA